MQSTLPILVALIFAPAHGLRLSMRAPSDSRLGPQGVTARMPDLAELASNPDAAIPPLAQRPGRKVALLVEPTPFTHVSGYSNRFKEMLRYLQAGGDTVEVVTPDDTPDRPADFLGIPITYVRGFRLFLYKQVQLTLDIGSQALKRLKRFEPTIIHAVTPGFFVLPAIIYSRILNVPLVISYHTHLPAYAERYIAVPVLREISVAVANWIVPTVLNFADLALATSPQLKAQLQELGCKNIEVWRKGIDTNVFTPAFNEDNLEMRTRLTGGVPDAPLLLYVGRLGAEKNIGMIRGVLDNIPEARLAIVGCGPAEEELRKVFEGTPTVFMGLMQGEELSRAYAGADVFVMPSESETLGFVVLESMASQVPAVCAKAGGLVNLIRDGDTGLFFEPGDVDDFIEKVKLLLKDSKLRRSMGEAAREETLNWDWRAATSVLRNYQYTLAEKRHAERQERWNSMMSRLNPFHNSAPAAAAPTLAFNSTMS
mmetsp:Transcript_32458/g.74345  ORF Transcript_32458/g.74345 Transcript_32458/m.74345 type:complete len:483 (+) Transcript_32458:44-1492(+)